MTDLFLPSELRDMPADATAEQWEIALKVAGFHRHELTDVEQHDPAVGTIPPATVEWHRDCGEIP